MAKQVWRLIKFPDSLVARVFKGRYFRDVDIMDAKVSSNASYSWRSICGSRKLIEKGLRWKVGNGRAVRAFDDAWIPGPGNGIAVSRPAVGDGWRVADFLNNSTDWNLSLLNLFFLPVEVEGITSIHLEPNGPLDSRFWVFDEKGRYTVKTGYLCATNYFSPHESTTSEEDKKWWGIVWSLNIPPKVKHFIWRALNDLLATDANLASHHVPNNGFCSWCRNGWGSTSHCLIFCDLVREGWKKTMFWEVMKAMTKSSFAEISKWVLYKLGLENLERWCVGLWSVWRFMCNVKHGGVRENIGELLSGSSLFLLSFQEARARLASSHQLLPKEGLRVWIRPRRETFRLDVDVSRYQEGRLMGVGFVVRNHTGKMVAAGAQKIGYTATILMGELHALLIGIGFCLEQDIGPIMVFSDSLLAIHVVQETYNGMDSLSDELFDVFMHAKKHIVLDFCHARREANRVAHCLANHAMFSDDVMIWKSDFPSWLLDIVHRDLE